VPDKEAEARQSLAFGAWARDLRKRRKLTQGEVASRVGITATYLSQIEKGQRNPTLAVIVGLARALGVKPSTLVSRLDALE
jgi:transcriptional regulator with XRE-family HTH domain